MDSIGQRLQCAILTQSPRMLQSCGDMVCVDMVWLKVRLESVVSKNEEQCCLLSVALPVESEGESLGGSRRLLVSSLR